MIIDNNEKFDNNSIIFFLHVPKSGGTSIRQGLMNYFNPEECLRLYEPGHTHYLNLNYSNNFQTKAYQPGSIKSLVKKLPLAVYIYNKIKNSKNLFIFKKENPLFRDFYSLKKDALQKLRFIASSQDRNICPPILGKKYLYVMSIRNSVERIQSTYYYSQTKKESKKPYILAAQKYNIDDYVKFLFDTRPQWICNPYSRCITGTEIFEEARKVIDDEFYLVAPFEKLDEFSKLLTSQFFGKEKIFPRLRVGKNNPKKNMISDKMTELIISKNQTDINLKKHVEVEFDRIYKNFLKT